MKIDEIQEMWSVDGEIDVANISKSGWQIPILHNKYYSMYVKENLRLTKMKSDMAILTKVKNQYYRGELDSQEMKEYGMEPLPLKILRQDIPQFMEADPDIIEQNLKIAFQTEIVGYLDSIIRQINNRNFVLRLILDNEKFKNGVN